MSNSRIDISGSGLGDVAAYMSSGDRLSGGVIGVVGIGAVPGVTGEDTEEDSGGGADEGSCSCGRARSIAWSAYSVRSKNVDIIIGLSC